MSRSEILATYKHVLQELSGDTLDVTFLTDSDAQLSLKGSEIWFDVELTDGRVKSSFMLDEYPYVSEEIVSALDDILERYSLEKMLFNNENEVQLLSEAKSLVFYSNIFDISSSKFMAEQIGLILDATRLFLDMCEPIDDEVFIEGAESWKVSKRYERSRALRGRAIAIHGTNCMICGMNFENTYGPVGKGFIHIHHILRISDGGIRSVDPEKDLIPICPNCHSMIHRENPPISPDELRNIIRGK